jgi:hypothetical protein
MLITFIQKIEKLVSLLCPLRIEFTSRRLAVVVRVYWIEWIEKKGKMVIEYSEQYTNSST